MRYIADIAAFTILILVVAFCSTAYGKNDQRIYEYDVQFYELSIRFDVERKSFSGSVLMTADALDRLDTIVLSASSSTLTIDSVFFNGRRVKFTHEFDHLNIIPTSKVTAKRSFEIWVFYYGVSKFHGEYESGGVLFDKVRGIDHIATSSQPYFARTWWPCKDVPDDKATLNINITVPNPMTAVSNGILKNI
ncbi:MAG: hypothetical protein EPO24_16300, partial [Bacteroidetes bacterium]